MYIQNSIQANRIVFAKISVSCVGSHGIISVILSCTYST